MFASFGACLAATVLIIGTQLPSRGAKKEAPNVEPVKSTGTWCRFEIIWFFASLVAYGVHMSLVESFLFVYLMEDFEGVSQKLLGASVATMCIFELPVFFYIKQLIDRFELKYLITACYMVLSTRCFAYSMLPRNMPWLVLMIEPMHGITMAAMWSCSVEFGRRLAPKGAEAQMQALIGGVYYRVSQGAGAFMWGNLTKSPPHGYGFTPMYRLAASTILLWAVIWNIGWFLQKRISKTSQTIFGEPLLQN